jgi:hypothetical protein
MGSVGVTEVFRASLQEVESGWYDTSRWPAWVDGLDRVLSIKDDWPGVGGSVTWESGPAGRGTVTEQVTAYERLVGQTLEVQDVAIRGRQIVAFKALGDSVEVKLSLQYSHRRGSIIMPLTDVLFIRREMTRSLARTLTRFAAELAARRAQRPSSTGDSGH